MKKNEATNTLEGWNLSIVKSDIFLDLGG